MLISCSIRFMLVCGRVQMDAVVSTSDGTRQGNDLDTDFTSEQSFLRLISLLVHEAYTSCGWALGDV